MSWQATAWAVRQKTGSAARKVLLLVLANYADEHGVCWPSQETLMAETELSADTIQRQTKVLKAAGLLDAVRRRRKDGTWPSLHYQLNLSGGPSSIPQNAARSEVAMPHCAAHHAALTTSTMPQALRHEPSIEPPSEPPIVADDAREPLISKPAMELAEQLLVIAGHDPKFWPPGWCGAPMRVQTWLNSGWAADIIIAATRAVASRKTGPPAASVQFFEKAIAEEIARQNRPVPEISHAQADDLYRPAKGNAYARIAASLSQSSRD
jgi:hypothetical protein